ncbi:MAG: pyridoxamine 5'-phosphate oxidase family protein [candidate division WOR-3 bacterium]|nr:pyridoxamine 5'-phosphate oxidase family protein [candidate division WOR-3 bacterium]
MGRSLLALVGSIGPGGFPNIKVVSRQKSEGVKRAWFITASGSHKADQFRRDPRACVYFLDAARYQGVMLVGKIEVRQDHETRQFVWKDEMSKFYPGGVDDSNWCVLAFTAEQGNFTTGAENADFAT